MCGNLETKCLKEPEESRDHAWVGQGGDREGNGQENWIDETLLAEAGDLQPREPHFISVCLWET